MHNREGSTKDDRGREPAIGANTVGERGINQVSGNKKKLRRSSLLDELGFQHGQVDTETAAFSQHTFCLDFSLVRIDN